MSARCFESAQHTGALARGVGVGTWVAIDERAGEGAVDEDGELAGGGGEGLWLADADSQAAVETRRARSGPGSVPMAAIPQTRRRRDWPRVRSVS